MNKLLTLLLVPNGNQIFMTKSFFFFGSFVPVDKQDIESSLLRKNKFQNELPRIYKKFLH